MRLVTEELVVGASIYCQSWALKLVAPCAWYKTPGSPVQVRTTLPALTLILTFEAGLTAGAEIAPRTHSDAKASTRNAEPRGLPMVRRDVALSLHALLGIGTAAAAKSLIFCTGARSEPSRQVSYIIRQLRQ